MLRMSNPIIHRSWRLDSQHNAWAPWRPPFDRPPGHPRSELAQRGDAESIFKTQSFRIQRHDGMKVAAVAIRKREQSKRSIFLWQFVRITAPWGGARLR